MKNRFLKFSLILFLIVVCFGSKAVNKGYEIKVKFKSLKDTVCYLGFHFGKNKYIRDTARVDHKGIAVFKGDKPIEGGIYLIIMPSKNFFEFIFTEKNISLETDTVDFIEDMKVIASEENKIFYGYMKYTRDKYFEKEKLRQELKNHKDNLDSVKILNTKISEEDSIERNYRENVMKKYPASFFVKVLKSLDEPHARGKLPGENDTLYSKFLYNYYQVHFFDNIDFSDSRMLRTPVFEEKVDKYMNELTIRNPDSINRAAERVIDKSRANDTVFKFILVKIFNKYAQSTYMGDETVFVFLAEKYYLSGLAYWTDSVTLNKIYTEVLKKRNNLIGKKAPVLIMKDTNDHYVSLYDIKKPYTILVFWDPGCSHCRALMPELIKWYNRHSKDSFEVYSVSIATERSKWIAFIKENNLNWKINVWDPTNATNFRMSYDAYSFPIIYIIDKNKVIQAKRIDIEKIDGLISILNKEIK